MGAQRFTLVAKTGILRVPESYPSVAATGLPHKLRPMVPGVLLQPGDDSASQALKRFESFARKINACTQDQLNTDVNDLAFRLYSRLELDALWEDGRLRVQPRSGSGVDAIAVDVGVDKLSGVKVMPPPPKVEAVVIKQVSDERFEFAWTVLGCWHPQSEAAFTEVSPRECSYIWHHVSGQVLLQGGRPLLRAGLTGSRFPSHALFVEQKRTLIKLQGAMGNLWISDPLFRNRVTSAGPAEYVGPDGTVSSNGPGGRW